MELQSHNRNWRRQLKWQRRRTSRAMRPTSDLIPADARVEMDAKKAAGYFADGDVPDAERLELTKGRGL